MLITIKPEQWHGRESALCAGGCGSNPWSSTHILHTKQTLYHVWVKLLVKNPQPPVPKADSTICGSNRWSSTHNLLYSKQTLYHVWVKSLVKYPQPPVPKADSTICGSNRWSRTHNLLYTKQTLYHVWVKSLVKNPQPPVHKADSVPCVGQILGQVPTTSSTQSRLYHMWVQSLVKYPQRPVHKADSLPCVGQILGQVPTTSCTQSRLYHMWVQSLVKNPQPPVHKADSVPCVGQILGQVPTTSCTQSRLCTMCGSNPWSSTHNLLYTKQTLYHVWVKSLVKYPQPPAHKADSVPCVDPILDQVTTTSCTQSRLCTMCGSNPWSSNHNLLHTKQTLPCVGTILGQVLGVVGCCEGIVYLASLGVQLILAYSWARPAILVAGKGRRGNVFISVSSLLFLFLFLPCSFISSFSFLPFSGRRHKMTYKGWHVIKPQHNQKPWLSHTKEF